jgi:hypothetical protein
LRYYLAAASSGRLTQALGALVEVRQIRRRVVKKPKFSFDKYKNIGSKLKRIRNDLLTLSVEVDNAYPHTSKVARGSTKAVEALDKLRSDLENQMCTDYPAETSGDNWKGIFYGTPRLDVVRPPRGT